MKTIKLDNEIPIIEIETQKDGYYAIYKNKKVYHKNNKPKNYMLEFPSKEEFDKQNQAVLLPADDYELKIVKVEEDTQDKYMSKPDKDGNKPQVRSLKVSLDIISFKDGGAVQDEEGKDATGRTLMFFGSPDSMGWKLDGTPSKTRSLVAYAMGQDMNATLKIEAWEQLLGKTICAEVIQKPNQKGQLQNRISRFIPHRRERGEGVKPPKTEDVPLEEEKKSKK